MPSLVMRTSSWLSLVLFAFLGACTASSPSGDTRGASSTASGGTSSLAGSSASQGSSQASGGASTGSSSSKQGRSGGSGGTTSAPGGSGGSSGGTSSAGASSITRSSGGSTARGGTGGSPSGGTAGTGAGNVASGGHTTGGPSATGGLGSSGGASGGTLSTSASTTTGSTGGSSSGGANGGTGGSAGRSTGGTSGSGGTTGGGYHACPIDGSVCKIMPFGDSITDGFNADTPGGYRVELFRRLHAAGKNITFVGSGTNGPDKVDGVDFPRNHEGHSGWTIDPKSGRSGVSTLLKNDGGSQSVMVKYAPHIVLLMIGTNDAIDNYDMANAPTRLGKLIDTIFSQLPDVAIIVAQPIPTRGDASKGDDTGTSARIKTFNDAIPAVVKSRADAGKPISVVDMFTPFTPKASLLEDQWHPNLQGYVVLGTQWYTALQSIMVGYPGR